LDPAEFDKFAEEYLCAHAKNIACTGEDPGYFSRYKIEEVRRRWDKKKRPEPGAILDFGTGIGGSLPFLAKLFPGAAITALDVSSRSLEIWSGAIRARQNSSCTTAAGIFRCRPAHSISSSHPVFFTTFRRTSMSGYFRNFAGC